MTELPLAQSNALEQLARTRPWVLLLAVCGFASALAISLMPIAAILTWGEITLSEAMFVALVPTLVYLPAILIPSVLLYRYAGAIRDARADAASLERAMRMQRLFFATLAVMIGILAILALLAPLILTFIA